MSTPLRPPLSEGFKRESRTRAAEGCRRGVLLINLGTPDKPEVAVVRRYLAEFLRDPEVIRLPRGMGWANGILGAVLARLHAPTSAAMYRRIWTDGGSPLKVVTEQQRHSLEQSLPQGWRVFCAMRYGNPSIWKTLASIEEAGIDELVVLPMYPQYSGPTTGTLMRLLRKRLDGPVGQLNISSRTTWYDDRGYIDAQSSLIQDTLFDSGLSSFDTHLLFTAHSLPVSYIERGDPYSDHLHRSIELVMRRLGWPADRASIAFQSRFGPSKWLEPTAEAELSRLHEAGVENVLICPISFTTDCLETLEELGMRCRTFFEEKGGRLYLCPALNTYPPFIQALKNLVLKGVRPMGDQVEALPAKSAPLNHEAPGASLDHASLLTIGLSLPGAMGAGSGPSLLAGDMGQLLRVKRPQVEVPALLRQMRDEGGLQEAWLWNTCHRFELYGVFPVGADLATREKIVARCRMILAGAFNDGLPLNVLTGGSAWHHLVRTVAGLNSGLPGDKEVVGQLDTAHRLAQQAGVAGPLAQRFVAEAVSLEAQVRSATGWGAFDTGYCHAALLRAAAVAHIDWSDSRVVAVGGSTTSRSVLTILADEFGVSSRDLTLVYRGHKKGGQIKLIRKAIGNGTRVRVDSYEDARLTQAIVDADVVVFGIDRDDRVLTPQRLEGLRDFRARPLVVLDFNTLESTTGLDSIPGVSVIPASRIEQEVGVFASELALTEQFSRAVAEAEGWIVTAVGHAGGAVASEPGVVSCASLPVALVSGGLRAAPIDGAMNGTEEDVLEERA